MIVANQIFDDFMCGKEAITYGGLILVYLCCFLVIIIY